MHHAVASGARTVRTGEDADTLFGGYLHHRAQTDWAAYLAHAVPAIAPPSAPIARWLEMDVLHRYLDPAVVEFARSLPISEVIGSVPVRTSAPSSISSAPSCWNCRRNRGANWRYGCLPRRFFPARSAWRAKTELQFGSGMCRLEASLATTVSAADRQRLEASGRRFWSDAHRGLFLDLMKTSDCVRNRRPATKWPAPGAARVLPVTGHTAGPAAVGGDRTSTRLERRPSSAKSPADRRKQLRRGHPVRHRRREHVGPARARVVNQRGPHLASKGSVFTYQAPSHGRRRSRTETCSRSVRVGLTSPPPTGRGRRWRRRRHCPGYGRRGREAGFGSRRGSR